MCGCEYHNLMSALERLERKVDTMSVQLDALKAEVQKNTTVTQSALALIQGLADQIVALKDDPVQLQALADQLRGDSSALAAAVTANTPTPPTP